MSSTLDSSQFRPVESTPQSPSAVAPADAGGAPVVLAPQADAARSEGSAAMPITGTDAGTDVGTGATDVRTGPDPRAREEAVSQMRAKAAAGSGQKTKIGPIPQTAAPALSQADQERLKQELSRTAATDVVSDDELEQKRRSIAEMRRKAGTHYRETLEKIEK